MATAYDGGLSGQNAGTLMPKEFEKLAALLDVFQPSERTPLIDCVEATKLAARWGQMVHRTSVQPVEPWMRPQLKGPGTKSADGTNSLPDQ